MRKHDGWEKAERRQQGEIHTGGTNRDGAWWKENEQEEKRAGQLGKGVEECLAKLFSGSHEPSAPVQTPTVSIIG